MSAVVRSHELEASARVAARMENGSLTGVLPFTCGTERVYGIPLRTVDACSNSVSYHAELVAERNAADLLAETLRAACEGKWDLFRMRNVVDDSPTARILNEAASTFGSALITQPTESSPYLKLEAGWQPFLKTQSANFRSNISRTGKKFTAATGARMDWFENGDNLDRLLADILVIEEASWKKDAGHAVSRRPHEQRYYQALLPLLAERNALMANLLYVNDKPAAYVLCCIWNGWAGHLKTSFDASVDHAGTHVINTSVERAFARGATEYDFLGDATHHKLKWTQAVRPHRDYWLYSRSARGKLIGALKKWRSRSSGA
jgi:hypothetical protein